MRRGNRKSVRKDGDRVPRHDTLPPLRTGNQSGTSSITRSPLSIFPDVVDRSVFHVTEGSTTRIVRLGHPHHCSCGSAQPCSHVVAVLTQVFCVKVNDPLLRQPGIMECQLEIFLGQLQTLAGECFICHADVGNTPGRCPACGCSFHKKCLELKCRATREIAVSCPSCAAHIEEVSLKDSPNCFHCRKAIRGSTFQCLVCAGAFFCATCYYSKGAHSHHPIVRVNNRASERAPAPAPRISDVLFREIAPEDYDTLLQLDEGDGNSRCNERDFSSLPKDVFSAQKHPIDTCRICLQVFTNGSKIVLFPCGHYFHIQCGSRWAIFHKGACPVDNIPLTH